LYPHPFLIPKKWKHIYVYIYTYKGSRHQGLQENHEASKSFFALNQNDAESPPAHFPLVSKYVSLTWSRFMNFLFLLYLSDTFPIYPLFITDTFNAEGCITFCYLDPENTLPTSTKSHVQKFAAPGPMSGPWCHVSGPNPWSHLWSRSKEARKARSCSGSSLSRAQSGESEL